MEYSHEANVKIHKKIMLKQKSVNKLKRKKKKKSVDLFCDNYIHQLNEISN